MADRKAGRFEFNSFVLKWIAIVTMLIDHVGAVFFDDIVALRCVGRLAFPIFCFLLVEGFYHTRDVKKYAVRLFVFALLSEVPYDLCFHFELFYVSGQNIFFTLLTGLLMMALLEREHAPWKRICILLIASAAAQLLCFDYGCMGIAMIFCFYELRGSFSMKAAFVAVLNILSGPVQAFGALALIPIWFYNGERGPSMKYFFYFFYPLHLLLLFGILFSKVVLI